MKFRTRSWPLSSIVLTLAGVAMLGMGLYFIAFRPALLPEDVRYIGVSAEQLNAVRPRLEAWLTRSSLPSRNDRIEAMFYKESVRPGEIPDTDTVRLDDRFDARARRQFLFVTADHNDVLGQGAAGLIMDRTHAGIWRERRATHEREHARQ